MADLNLKLRFQALGDMVAPFKKLTANFEKLKQSTLAGKNELSKLKKQLDAIGRHNKLKAQIADNNNALVKMRAHLKATHSELKKHGTAKLRKEYLKAQQATKNLEKNSARLQKTLANSRKTLSSAGISTRELAKHEQQLKTQVVNATNALNQQEQQLRKLQQRESKLAALRAKASAAKSKVSNIGMKGAGAAVAGTAGLFGLGRLLSPAIDFEREIDAVGAITNVDKLSKEYELLKNKARELGATTQFTANEAARGMRFLAMAGFKVNDQLATMPHMLDLAKIGELDLGTTSDIASNILGAFEMPATEMQRVSDVIAATITNTNTDIRMIGDSMQYAAKPAKDLNISFEQAAAMIGLLGNVGIQGQKAGTALRSIYNRLAAPPSEARKMIKKLNIDIVDENNNLRDMTAILSDVAKATQKFGNAERLEAFTKIAGLEAGNSLSELVRLADSGAITKLDKQVQAARGFGSKTALRMSDNISGDIYSLTSAWGDFQIELTDGVNAPLRELLQLLTRGVRTLSGFVKEHKTLTKYILIGVGAISALLAVCGSLLALLSPLIIAILSFKFGIGALILKATGASSVFGLLTTAAKALFAVLKTNPIIFAASLFAVAATLIYKNWAGITDFFATLWRDIKSAFTGGFAGINNLIVEWNPLTLFTRAIHIALEALGVNVPVWFGELGKNMVSGLTNGIVNAAGNIKTTVQSLGTNIKTWFCDLFGINSPSTVFAEFGAHLISGLVLGLQNKLGWAKEAIGNVSSSLIAGFKNLLGINSPSKVFFGFGENISQGAALGIDADRPQVVKAAAKLAALAPASFNNAKTGAALAGAVMLSALPAAASNTHNSSANFGAINITINAQNADAREVASEVKRALLNLQNDMRQRQKTALYD